MKKILGAIAAAMLLGTGCAHDRGNTSQANTSAQPQASSVKWGASSGLTCELINANEAGISSADAMTNESSDAWGGSASESSDAWGGSASESVASQQSGTGGSASDECLPVKSGTGGSASGNQVIEGTATGGSASGADVSAGTAIGGSISEEDTSLQSGIGGSASDTGASDNAAAEDLAPEADTFEDTGMGGAGGGGG